jgi:hypothetical protein
MTNNVFRKPAQFGNLLGIKGRFISQSPLQIVCFDQKETLKQQTEKLLHADPNDAVGLFQQGRLFKSEGKQKETIESLRASLQSKPTAEAADALRKTLLDAMRKDYAAWASAGEELESLAEFPDEWGEILYARAEGIVRSGQTDDLVSLLKKVFVLDLEEPILVLADEHLSANIYHALGNLISRHVAKSGAALKNSWEELAETFYQQHVNRLGKNPPAESFKKFERINQSPKWERNASLLTPEMKHWMVFIKLFRGTSAAEKAKQLLRDELEKHHLHTALELLDTPATPEPKKPDDPFVWKQGIVKVHDVTAAGNAAAPHAEKPDQEQQRITNIVNLLLHQAKDADLHASKNMRPVPVLDQFDSLAPFNYFLEISQTASYLSCCTVSGEERWRLPLPSDLWNDEFRNGGRSMHHPSSWNRMTDQSLYITGRGHYILFVRDSTVTAIDTAGQSDTLPKILWTKTVSSALLNRQNTQTVPLNLLARSDLPRGFPRSSLFVSPHAVCCRDTGYVYGLDPMTGQTLWIRKIPQEQCSIFGDSENVFLVFPDVCRAVAVDPSSGRELESGTIPAGGVYVFGTNIVFLKPAEGRTAKRSLLIGDLRDLFDKQRRALLVSDTAQGGAVPTLPTELMLDNLNHTTLFQMLRNDRYLAAVTWETKTMQIYDLLLKQKMLPEGIDLSLFGQEPFDELRSPSFDVELLADQFLVTFVKSADIQNEQELIQSNNISFKRNYNNVNNGQEVSIGSGMIMLFGKEGKTCWSEPVGIKNWYRLLNVPKEVPVSLFGVGITDREEKSNRLSLFTGLMGIDKRSGKVRFRKLIPPLVLPNHQRIDLRNFQVFADAQAEEISFVVPNSIPRRIVKAAFTEETDNAGDATSEP